MLAIKTKVKIHAVNPKGIAVFHDVSRNSAIQGIEEGKLVSIPSPVLIHEKLGNMGLSLDVDREFTVFYQANKVAFIYDNEQLIVDHEFHTAMEVSSIDEITLKAGDLFINNEKVNIQLVAKTIDPFKKESMTIVDFNWLFDTKNVSISITSEIEYC
jgi:hypothetical protein